MGLESVATPMWWVGFTVLVLVLLTIDLSLHRDGKALSFKESGLWAAFWVGLAIIFGFAISPFIGPQHTVEYFTGYIIEKALSVDNLFVFIVVFGFFRVPIEHQRKILYWGIIGALVMRAIFIVVGAALLAKFHWLIYVFGAFLVYTGIKLFKPSDEEVDPSKNLALRLFRKLVPVSDHLDGGKFFTLVNGKRMATPLMVVLVVIEATDLVFAVDSIPAIFAVTQDPFIVYSSNVFAILGLRSLYFLLANAMTKFEYLNIGLAVVLIFVGTKMLVMGFFKIPVVLSLVVVAGVLTLSVVASLIKAKRDQAAAEKKANES